MGTKIKHFIELLLIFLLSIIFKILPLKISFLLMWGIAYFFHYILRFRRKEALDRIESLYGNQFSNNEIKMIAWKSWRNLCFNILELLRIDRLSEKYIKKINLLSTLDTLKNKYNGKGVIFATIHMGNWELAGISLNLIGSPVFSIARPQKNTLIDKYLNYKRGKFGLEVLSNEGGALQKIIKRIKKNECFLILPDVRNIKSEPNISFLNKRAKLGLGTAAFAKKCDVEIIPFVIRRYGFFNHKITVLDSVIPSPNVDKQSDNIRMMNDLMHIFTKEIDKSPEQYFWYNKRWVLEQ